jgi:hypothetical protein
MRGHWVSILIFLVLQSSCFAQSTIYWTERRADSWSGQFLLALVVRGNADGSNPTAIAQGDTEIKGPNGLEYGNGFLFWPDEALHQIYKCDPDGKNVVPFMQVDNPSDIFIGKDRIYWTSNIENYLDSTKLDGTDKIRILSTPTITSPFAVEVTSSNIFWSEIEPKGRIRRSDLNGENIVTVVSNVYCTDIQIVGDFIYLADDYDPGAIKRAHLDGSNLTTVLPVVARSIYVTRDFIYWAEGGSVNRADLNGVNPKALYTPPSALTWIGGVVALESMNVPFPPKLGSPQVIGTTFVFSVQSEVGKTTYVEKASSVPSSAWNNVTTLTGAADPVLVTNTISTSAHSEFFRARSE